MSNTTNAIGSSINAPLQDVTTVAATTAASNLDPRLAQPAQPAQPTQPTQHSQHPPYAQPFAGPAPYIVQPLQHAQYTQPLQPFGSPTPYLYGQQTVHLGDLASPIVQAPDNAQHTHSTPIVQDPQISGIGGGQEDAENDAPPLGGLCKVPISQSTMRSRGALSE